MNGYVGQPGDPFEVVDGVYAVLVAAGGLHSVWPAHAAAPPGWAVVHGPAALTVCLDYVDRHISGLWPGMASA